MRVHCTHRCIYNSDRNTKNVQQLYENVQKFTAVSKRRSVGVVNRTVHIFIHTQKKDQTYS